MKNTFNREKHIYRSDSFDELIKDIIRFFNETPVLELPPAEKFEGTGVYAIYYTGSEKLYEKINEKNRLGFFLPIYVGKAVARGWRQAKADQTDKKSSELHTRLREHGRSIEQVTDLNLLNFHCRFVLLDDSLIATFEAALIRFYQPLWNTVIDGFGNHDPGKGRYNQAKSDWDIIHPGRHWADKCLGQTKDKNLIMKAISHYLSDRSEP